MGNEYKLCCITYFARSDPDQQKTLCLEPTLLSQTVIIPSTESNRDKLPWGGCERMKFNKHKLFQKAAKDARPTYRSGHNPQTSA